MNDKLVLASDHAGWELKMHLIPFLEALGCQTTDVGTFSQEPVDYPEFTHKAALLVAGGEFKRGLVCCGTGQGDAMAANKVAGIRAALCWDLLTARLSRAHNDANMLVLGGWLTEEYQAEEIVRLWLETPFGGGRHERRVQQIQAIEREMKARRGRVYDISPLISPGMVQWPGDAEVEFYRGSLEGVPSLTSLRLSAHTGSHVDAPAHMIAGGNSVDAISLKDCLGLARVVQLPPLEAIDRPLLETMPLQGVARLLFRTQNSALYDSGAFHSDYAYLTQQAAEYLVELGIRLVGLDYLSVDSFESTTYPVHHTLMANGVVIVEGVNLRDVSPGDYELLCLPVKLAGADGAPARLVLRELE